MTCVLTIADTTPSRTDLRLVVLAQWIRAGLDLVRGATTTGRGLVGGAVTLWRLAQAVRLAILLAQRLKAGQGAPRVSTPCPSPTQRQAEARELTPPDDDALRRAMAELEAAMAGALDWAPPGRVCVCIWDRERPVRFFARASQEARGPRRGPHGLRVPPRGQRPVRPPGAEPPGRRRRSRPARALEPTSPPIAPLAIGRRPLAWAR
jgi:hypothetical protein